MTTTTRPGGGGFTTTTLPSVTTTTPTSVTTTTTLPTGACGGQLLLLGNDGVYLGCLTCGTASAESVFNTFGPYGNPFSATSVNNQYSNYGNPFGGCSACNPYSSCAPFVIDESACVYGRFSVNQYAAGSVCGMLGTPLLCDAALLLCDD